MTVHSGTCVGYKVKGVSDSGVTLALFSLYSIYMGYIIWDGPVF